MIDDLLRRYREDAAVHARADYADRSSVRAVNGAAESLRRTAAEIAALGPPAVERFGELLDDPNGGLRTWAAFHLLEVMQPPRHLSDRAFTVLEAAARGEGVEALGISMRLRELRNRS